MTVINPSAGQRTWSIHIGPQFIVGSMTRIPNVWHRFWQYVFFGFLYVENTKYEPPHV